MAATWEYTLVFSDLSAKILTATATRTDGVDVRAFTIPGILADTDNKPLTEIRDEVAAAMQAQYQSEVANEAKIVTLLNGWADALKNATEALEP